MSILGIVGGIGPESTIEYYRAIIGAYQERRGQSSQPPIVINSIDAYRMLALFAEGRHPEAIEYLGEEVRRLGDAGATVGLLAANTPHIVFDQVQARSPIPLVSIVTATLASCVQPVSGIRRFSGRASQWARDSTPTRSRRRASTSSCPTKAIRRTFTTST